MEAKAYLALANGQVFEAERFGAPGETIGELVFNTSMTGYLETLTDPSYFGQIVVATFPLIGNYGDIPADYESAGIHMSAYIVRQWCQDPSNFRCGGDLDAFLKRQGVIGLCGVDTRRLTRIIRESGVMNAAIVDSREQASAWMERVRAYEVRDAVANVTCDREYVLKPEKPARKVALWDFGAKANISRELVKRGCEVAVLPGSATAEEILAHSPDGIMLTNGPGDPAENTGIIGELRKVCASGTPIFGICLGHQLLALARGARTEKLKYGHRGANQPALDRTTGRTYVTSQNHGYAVRMDALPRGGAVRFTNVNDGTCEGIQYRDIPAFSVQFHPEACGGPLDTSFLFDEFIKLMEDHRHAAQSQN